MEYFEIQGGKQLEGSVDVRGSKNATTPVLAATLLTTKPCTISNIPLVEDVLIMIQIIESMGATVSWPEKRTVCIESKNIDPSKIDVSLIKKMRSSILLLGALSARCDEFSLYHPGGCVIGARPVGTHFDALEKMGIDIREVDKKYKINARDRKSAFVVLKEFSVTATENVMMLASRIPQKTIIKIAAAEPHVEDLGKMLQGMGVTIKGLGTHTIEIQGKEDLDGVTHELIPDANEAATFLILGVATRSPIRVNNARIDHLDLVIEKLREFGADFIINENSIEVVPMSKLQAVTKIDARIYPGIPSDIQAPFGVLATQAKGSTQIHDTLFEGRFNYIHELVKMGAEAEVLNDHQARINGRTDLKGTAIKSYDLRCGASLIIAALLAEGTTRINDIYQVDRGYEHIEERLQKLGAVIERKKDASL